MQSASMKLYVFDSCPYCVRVRALIGIKGIPCEVVPIALGGWPDHVTKQTEATTVPMLEVTVPESGENRFIRESGDILAFLDQTTSEVLLDRYEPSDALQQWLETVKDASARLCYPRMRRLNLPELATDTAMAMFEERVGKRLGLPLDDALATTDQQLPVILAGLQRLDGILDVHSLLTQSRAVTMDDLCAFAELRNLMMVAELALPTMVRAFVDYMSLYTAIPLYQTVDVSYSLIS